MWPVIFQHGSLPQNLIKNLFFLVNHKPVLLQSIYETYLYRLCKKFQHSLISTSNLYLCYFAPKGDLYMLCCAHRIAVLKYA